MDFSVTFLLVLAVQNSHEQDEADVYKYTSEVKAEVYQPVQYESSSKINGHFLIQSVKSDGNSRAYIMALQNLTISMYNGISKDKVFEEQDIDQNVKEIEKPFFVSYDEDGQFEGVKFVKDDTNWSKNVKLSIASALQLNSSLAEQSNPNFSFFDNENTIHGNCRISNDVTTKSEVNGDDKILSITRNYIPKYCRGYAREVFNLMFDHCFRSISDDSISSVNKIIELQVKGNRSKLMKYEGDEIETYMPFLHKSDGLIVHTKQALNYEKTIKSEVFSKSLFDDVPLVQEAAYAYTTTFVVDGARDDITQGRRNFKKEAESEIIRMLRESYDYINSDRFTKSDPNLTSGNNINKIFDALIFFDYNTMNNVWEELTNTEETQETVFMRKSFLDIICYVGTKASASVIRDVITSGKIRDAAATDVLAKFPQYVSNPKEELLQDMEILLNLKENISYDVKKASILAFASLIFRIYQDYVEEDIPQNLEKYLQYFNDKMKSSIENNDNEMVLVYIMAFQNIKVGNIERFLWPILRKDIKIQEDSDRIRVATAFALFSGISWDHDLVHNVYFPIFNDESEYVPLRAISFLRLMYVTQLDSQRRPMEMYWQYTREKDPMIRNLHFSQIVSNSNFGTQCRQTIRETYEKIIRFAEIKEANYSMPSIRFVDFDIKKYGYGESLIQYILKTNVNTGLPDIGAFMNIIADGRRPGPFVQFYWMFEGLDEVLLDGLKYFLKDQDIQDLLIKYQSQNSENTDATFTLIPFYGFQASQVHYYNKKMSGEKKNQFWKHLDDKMNFTSIFYGDFKESTGGTDIGVPDCYRHHDPTFFSYKLNNDARLDGTILYLKLKAILDIWSHESYDFSIYNAIADIFHTVRRSTSVDAIVPMDIDISYDLETKTLKIFTPEISNSTKLLTYSKIYTQMDDNENPNYNHNYNRTVVVTKGDDFKEAYHSTFESNRTNVKYNMDIFDCESEFNPDLDKKEWLEAIFNSDRNNIHGSTMQDLLIAKQKLVVDMTSPRPGICGVLREYIATEKSESPYVELKLGEN